MKQTQQSIDGNSFLVRFWGVRGSYPGLTPATRKIGGNTSCVEVTVGKHRLIFDAGTGIIPLGQTLAGQKPQQLKSHVFISHTHLDHIFGLCFFDPLRIVGARTLIYGPGWKGRSFDSRFQQLTRTSMLPVALQDLKGSNRFFTVNGGEAIVLGPDGNDPMIRRVDSAFQAEPDRVTVTTHSSPAHPGNGVMLYRIDYRGKSLVYASDVEQSEKGYPDIVEFCRGTDLLIHDAQYLRPEYYSKTKAKKGWGHSTIEMAVNVARRSGAKRLALFHHDPMHDDRVMQRIEKAARKSFRGSLVAREGGKLAF